MSESNHFASDLLIEMWVDMLRRASETKLTEDFERACHVLEKATPDIHTRMCVELGRPVPANLQLAYTTMMGRYFEQRTPTEAFSLLESKLDRDLLNTTGRWGRFRNWSQVLKQVEASITDYGVKAFFDEISHLPAKKYSGLLEYLMSCYYFRTSDHVYELRDWLKERLMREYHRPLEQVMIAYMLHRYDPIRRLVNLQIREIDDFSLLAYRWDCRYTDQCRHPEIDRLCDERLSPEIL